MEDKPKTIIVCGVRVSCRKKEFQPTLFREKTQGNHRVGLDVASRLTDGKTSGQVAEQQDK